MNNDRNKRLNDLISIKPKVNQQHSNSTCTSSTEQRSKNSAIDFSIIFFSNSEQENSDHYQFIYDVSEFADRHAFKAIWLPERHYHPFGGSFPNPAILASAIAARTQTVRLRAGSVVLPLHHPTEVVEAWGMIDCLSKGRVDLGFASGWNPNDFILCPDQYEQRKKLWQDRIPEVKALWAGDSIAYTNGVAEKVKISTYPRPIQKELNVWYVVTKLDESFRYAGLHGYNVLTMLQGIDLDQLGSKIAMYRQARSEAGLNPNEGVVSLMLHTLVSRDPDFVRSTVEMPFRQYIQSALKSHIKSVDKDSDIAKLELDKIVDYSFERYYQTGALFGTVEQAEKVVQHAIKVGVNEIACLVEFGVDHQLIKQSLPCLHLLQEKFRSNNCSEKPTTEALV